MRRFTQYLLSLIGILFIVGCGPPYTDVSSAPQYGFGSFAGTTWKTKVRLAVAKAQGDIYLWAPRHFDPSVSNYDRPNDLGPLTFVAPGTQVHIDRLMKSNGNWAGYQIAATVLDDSGVQKTVFLDKELLEKNKFLWLGEPYPATWAVNPEFLEK